MKGIPPNDDHYIDRVIEAGPAAGLVTSQPIVDEQGMILVGGGQRVTPSLRERLVHHKLLRPIDTSLIAEKPIEGDDLAGLGESLLDRQPLLRRFAARVPDRRRLLDLVRHIEIPDPLRVKLTVGATDDTRLDHLLSVTLTALAIGMRQDLPGGELKALGLAAILHDLGKLHLPPSLFSHAGELSDEMRRQIEAHPVIMHAILKSLGPRYTPAAEAILEHHERTDGSGYPRGITAEAFSPLGAILALAEFVVSLRDRRDCIHTLTALKMHRHQFDPAAVSTLFYLLGETLDAQPQVAISTDELHRRLDRAARTAQEWVEAGAAVHDAKSQAEFEWLAERGREILTFFRRLSLQPDAIDTSLSLIADDPVALNELAIITDEMERRLRDTQWEARRRLGNSGEHAGLPPTVSALLSGREDR